MSYSPGNRNLTASTPFGDGVLIPVRLSGDETISAPFRFEVDLVSDRHDLDLDAAIGRDLAVHLRTASGHEHFHGVVDEMEQVATAGALAKYRVVLVPRFALLKKMRDYVVFQGLSVPAIVRQILAESGVHGVTLATTQEYPPRDYCVQYGETRFDFVSRLLEAEGIRYWFEHEENRHVMVLADAATSPRCGAGGTARYQPTASRAGGGDTIWGLRMSTRVETTAIALDDYNDLHPRDDLAVRRARQWPAGELEAYDYPGGHDQVGRGNRSAQVRLEALFAHARALRGEGTCRFFRAGAEFELVEHLRADFNAIYLLRHVHHEIDESGTMMPAGASHAPHYGNSFTAMPTDRPYRPLQVTPRPTIRGVQTAVVVGPPGEDIYTDQFGRVKVQFHWDRRGRHDQDSSCWIRVNQGWAGPNWGSQFLPRIGQEVIVEFLESDPDRPLVTGRLYNGEAMHPFDLPAERHTSGIRSRSTPGGGPGLANEIVLVDDAGKERLVLHAQRDLETTVENDRRETVSRDCTRETARDAKKTVGRDQNDDIGRNSALKVGQNADVQIGNDESRRIGGNAIENIAGNETRSVSGSRQITVSVASMETIALASMLNVGGAMQTSVGGACNQTIGAAWTTEVGDRHALFVGGSSQEEIEETKTVKAKTIVLQAEDELVLKVGPAMIVLKKTGEITIRGLQTGIN